jgi:MFS family permease
MTEKYETTAPYPTSPAWRRKLLFTALYFSEGAPIGFIWLVIPVQLRLAGLPLENITRLSAVLIIPWTFKFLWAPLVDSFRSARWTLRHWVVAAQTVMGLTLVPLVWLDPVADFYWLAATLLVHAAAAATQDVSIDALCIASTSRDERGSYNGWMQVGMLLGRATMGGGLLTVIDRTGQAGAVALLLTATLFSMGLLFATRLPIVAHPPRPESVKSLLHTYLRVLEQPLTWWGIAFALVAGAAFKSFEFIYPLYMVDRGFGKQTIASFTAGPMIGSMVIGSILGGWWTDRAGPGRLARNALVTIAGLISVLAFYDRATDGVVGWPLFAMLILIGLAIGVFTAASYALFMNLTKPGIAATQFSTFMGAVNGCESWSIFVLGRLVAARGYDLGLLAMCAISLFAIPILARLHGRENGEAAPEQ